MSSNKHAETGPLFPFLQVIHRMLEVPILQNLKVLIPLFYWKLQVWDLYQPLKIVGCRSFSMLRLFYCLW